MAKTIDQTVEFGGVTAERLFNLYMDPEQHKAAIGGPVEIEPHAGGRFSAARDEAFVAHARSLRGSPEQKAIAKEHLAVCFSCALRNLAPYEAASLLLREVYGFSTSETAETLESTQIQVKNWLQRARRTLEARYAQTCALVAKEGVCHQCVELDTFFNGRRRDPLDGTARDIEARLDVLRSQRETSLGSLHRRMLRILDDVISGG
jgi:hypothetical protein